MGSFSEEVCREESGADGQRGERPRDEREREGFRAPETGLHYLAGSVPFASIFTTNPLGVSQLTGSLILMIELFRGVPVPTSPQSFQDEIRQCV